MTRLLRGIGWIVLLLVMILVGVIAAPFTPANLGERR